MRKYDASSKRAAAHKRLYGCFTVIFLFAVNTGIGNGFKSSLIVGIGYNSTLSFLSLVNKLRLSVKNRLSINTMYELDYQLKCGLLLPTETLLKFLSPPFSRKLNNIFVYLFSISVLTILASVFSYLTSIPFSKISFHLLRRYVTNFQRFKRCS